MLVHGDDDGKSENNDSREQETSSIICIFQTIRRSEDVTDAAKSKNSQAICDLGLSIVKRLTKAEVNLDAPPVSAALLPALYKLYESKEVDGSDAREPKTWLADESIWTHFDSLKLEISSKVPAENPGDTDLKENDKDGSELPLKKMMKRLKPHGTKSKKGKPVKSEKEKVENDIDVLKMVREINLDSLGLSNIAHGSEDKASLHKRLGSSPDSDILASGFSKKKSSLSKQRGKGSDEGQTEKSDEVGEVHDDDLKTDKREPTKSPLDSMKKRKRKVMGGLAKGTMMETESLEDLIGCKIKVWWPMDKKFYEGTIKSYDPSRNKHVVLYDDGDVEILNLEKERWELTDKGQKSAKKLKSLKTTSKRVSSGQKIKISGNLPGIGESFKMVKAKGTPKKQKPAQLGALETNSDEVEDKHRISDLSEVEPSTSTREDDLKLDDLEVEKGSNKRTDSKRKRKPTTSDEETGSPIQDNIGSDDEEDAPVKLPDRKGSNKRARSKPESKQVKGKKRNVGRKEASDEDGADSDHPVEDDRKSNEEENVLVSSAKKKGSNQRAGSSLKRKPVKGKKKNLDLEEATDEEEGPRARDILMQDAENSTQEDNTAGNLTYKRGSKRKASSKPKRKPVKDKLESARLAEASKEEARDNAQSPIEDDRRSDEEQNPPLGESDKEESNSEPEMTRSKPKIQGKTEEKSPEPSADEKIEIPDDEPLKLWKRRVGKSLKKVG
ncbi:hypothetical protein CRG98_013231 [Punica granatum]|uniref:Uncharacterized protein n=1 Tax=Punica granatum TaxID=22663 RepID=A0A2I0KD23_PUNGR|nr:hypothetical protein CRG98_013231 [Punica granatum]